MMNDRWSELAEECWDERIDGYHFDQEMFAKLIVQECADYFGREGDRRFEVDGNWIAKTIKQHFGIEE
jgi:hypothetical protein